MDPVKQKAIALRDECERQARAAEKEIFEPGISEQARTDAQDRARALWIMSRKYADLAYHAEQARPEKFSGANRGAQDGTLKKSTFLRELALEIGTSNREALAAHALERYPSKVRAMWRAGGDSARRKMLNFMRNNRVP